METGERFRGVLPASFVRCPAVGRVVLFRPEVGGAERRAGGVKGFPATAVGEDAEVADSVETARRDVGQEPGDEGLGREGFHAVTGLSLPRELRFPAAEPHGLAVEVEDAAVTDGNSMCVTRAIFEDLLRAPERRLRVDHPVLSAGGGDGVVEGCRAGKMGDAAGGLIFHLSLALASSSRKRRRNRLARTLTGARKVVLPVVQAPETVSMPALGMTTCRCGWKRSF